MATGAKGDLMEQAKTLILWYTQFVNPIPAPATLMSQVHKSWLQPLADIPMQEIIKDHR